MEKIGEEKLNSEYKKNQGKLWILTTIMFFMLWCIINIVFISASASYFFHFSDFGEYIGFAGIFLLYIYLLKKTGGKKSIILGLILSFCLIIPIICVFLLLSRYKSSY